MYLSTFTAALFTTVKGGNKPDAHQGRKRERKIVSPYHGTLLSHKGNEVVTCVTQ